MLLGSCIVLAACSDKPECYNFNYASQFNYKTNFNQTTPNGIKVDTSGQNISLELIDKLTEETETCLTKNFGSPTSIPDDVMEAGQCVVREFNCPLNRKCFKVKIPSDWLLSCDGSQQLLPAKAPTELCEAKGLTPNAECPCRWRAGIQDDYIIVATPSLYLYKDPLVRMITGCNNPWAHPKLAECASPTVPPL